MTIDGDQPAKPANTLRDDAALAMNREVYAPPNRSETTQATNQTLHNNTPVLSLDRFAKVAEQVLYKIDVERTGHVTKEQLAKALQDPSFKGEEAQALAAMYMYFDQLHNINQFSASLPGITYLDLDKLNEYCTAKKHSTFDAVRLNSWAHANFSKFANSAGCVSEQNIESALTSQNTTDQDKIMLQFLKQHFTDIANNGVITLADIDDYQNHKIWNTPNTTLLDGIAGLCTAVNYRSQGGSISHNLYADKNPIDSIKSDAVVQGFVSGDCTTEAAIASVAFTHPDIILNSIKDNHDGTYTVTFPGAKDDPITVSAPTEAEMGLFNSGSKRGIWACVLEKAYGEYRRQHFWSRDPFIANSNTPQESLNGEPIIGSPLEFFTGHKTSTTILYPYVYEYQKEGVFQKLQTAFSSYPPKAVTAGSNVGDALTKDGMYMNHEYSVIGFSPEGTNAILTIRDPQGKLMQISLEEFLENFGSIIVES